MTASIKQLKDKDGNLIYPATSSRAIYYGDATFEEVLSGWEDAEVDRKTSEAERKTKETERLSAESNRINAENSRDTEERERLASEESRTTAEYDRQVNTARAIENCEAATEAAEEAATTIDEKIGIKVDKQQGTENAGKVMTVGDDGLLSPEKSKGGSVIMNGVELTLQEYIDIMTDFRNICDPESYRVDRDLHWDKYAYWRQKKPYKTFPPLNGGGNERACMGTYMHCKNLIRLSDENYGTHNTMTLNLMFDGCVNLVYAGYWYVKKLHQSLSVFSNTPKLEEFYLYGLNVSFTAGNINGAPKLKRECVRYMIDNATNVNPITITLMEEAYNRLLQEDFDAAEAKQITVTHY